MKKKWNQEKNSKKGKNTGYPGSSLMKIAIVLTTCLAIMVGFRLVASMYDKLSPHLVQQTELIFQKMFYPAVFLDCTNGMSDGPINLME